MDKHTFQNCRWAEPTLFLPTPYWLDAWILPWTCRHDDAPRLVDAPGQCETCIRWEARRIPAPFGTE